MKCLFEEHPPIENNQPLANESYLTDPQLLELKFDLSEAHVLELAKLVLDSTHALFNSSRFYFMF